MEVVSGALSPALNELNTFKQALEHQKGSKDDPKWHIFTYISARFSGGSRELLQGAPVDPKSNPTHRHAVQYLADLGLLATWRGSLVTSVGYFSSEQTCINKSMLLNTSIDRLIYIGLNDKTSFVDSEGKEVTLNYGDLLVVTKLDELRSCKSGSGVLVVMGYPEYRTRAPVEAIKASIVLTSRDLNFRATTNRVMADQPNTFQGQVACPDCRRPIRFESNKDCDDTVRTDGDHDLLVTLVSDAEEVEEAIQMGIRVSSRFPRRFIVLTDQALISDQLKMVWPDTVVTSPILRWSKRRGMHDYAVPEGFASPILFPKGERVKDSFYSLVQAIGVPALWGKRIWLVDPNGDHGVDVVPSRAMHRQMVAELKDWTHPCHKWRDSPVAFIQEWVTAYKEPQRFASPTVDATLVSS